MRALPIIFLSAFSFLRGQEAVPSDPLDALVRDSPFMPGSGSVRAVASGDSGPLEFRSVVFEQGRYLFSVYDQGSRESKWVTLGQQDLPFVARSYNQEQDVLTVEFQGRTLALKLQEAQIGGQSQPGSAPAPPALPSAEESSREGGGRSAPGVQPNPSPASPPVTAKPAESQRLQEMADEIRRRRQQPAEPPQN